MLALARPSVNEVWPLAANQNHRYNRPANDNNITSGLCTRTKYVYDRNRRIISSSETVTVGGVPVTRTTSKAYYANGTLKELTDANGNVTHWDIDIQSRPTAKTYAFGTANAKTESFTYDVTGRPKTRTDARGQTLTTALNKDDTVASYAFTNAVVATPGASFVYDPWYPRRTSMVDQFGTTTWTYKAVGTNGALLPDVEDGPFANDSVTLAYDAAGRANSRTISGTAAETFGFDTLGRMNSHVTALGSFTYGYLGNSGQVASRTIGGITTNWGYDTNTNDRRLLTIATTGAVARNFTYTSNPYQITGITDTAPGTHPWLSQTWSFTHDASDRLLTGNGTIAGNHSYTLDKLDNATGFAGVTGTYNSLNQISTFNAVAYTYDANGNLSSDGTSTYTFDAADRLKTVTQGATTVTFAYDGLGRRLNQTVGATETRYLWCGAAICQQRSGSDTAEKRFYSEGEYVHTGTKKYLTLTDHLGSVRDVIDITGTPTLVGSFDYRPYGAVARSWGTVTTGYTYARLFAQPNTGLLISTTRAYNPANGKWLNVDPIREEGGINLTGYVGAGPMAAIDPLGLKFRFADGIDPGYIADYLDAIEYLRNNSSIFRAIYDALDKSANWYTIGGWTDYSGGNAYFPPLRRVHWNPKAAMKFCPGVDAHSPALSLAHEIVHAWRHDNLGGLDDSKYPWYLEFWTGPEELAALKIEALIAWQLGESFRPIHRPGWYLPVPSPVPPMYKNEVK